MNSTAWRLVSSISGAKSMLVILAFFRRSEIAPSLPVIRLFDHLSPILG
jgi:hypothetical protein